MISVAVIWGLGFVFTKVVLSFISPALLNILRFSLASAALFAIFPKKVLALKRKEWLIGAITALPMAAGFALQTYGINKTSPSNAALITSLNIVMVPFLAWAFFKTRPPKKAFFAAFLAFACIAVLSAGGFSSLNVGDLLCFFCAVAFAVHFIVLGKTSSEVDLQALSFLQMFFAAVFFLIIGLAFDFKALTEFTFDKSIIFPLFSLCFLSTAYAYVIQTRAMSVVSPSKTSLVLSLEALFGSLFSVIFGIDKFTWPLAVAMFGMTAALVISERPQKSLPAPSPDNSAS